jgi:hypothetical protein
MNRVFHLLVLFFVTSIRATSAAQPGALLGPVEESAILDDFIADSKAVWSTTVGSNVRYQFDTGRNIPGVANSLAQIDLLAKDVNDRVPEHNWFSMKRRLSPGSISADVNGIRLIMGSQPSAQWWINVSLRIGNKTWSHVLEPTYPSRTLIEHVIPFEEFKSSGEPFDRAKAQLIDGIGLDTSAPRATLFIDRITTYRQQSYDSWMSFESSHRQHNIFQPGEKVAVTLTPGGTNSRAKAFRYEVKNFYEQTTAVGRIQLDRSTNYTLDLTPKTHGFYELRAYWLDEKGSDLENRSCILSEGSVPSGIATFAVMPRSVAQNVERFKSLGTNAFFGLHGDFMGLADLMGLTWRFDYSLWNYLEPSKPDRSEGIAPWAAVRIKNESARPEYSPHILPFAGNFGAVAWAKDKVSQTAPFVDWEDYLPMVRDNVEVEKHLYPHMSPRIYGVAWEVNLNMPPDNLGPRYDFADIVELHRRVRDTIKAADTNAFVIGPCPSNLNPQWLDSVFAAGLLKYVDGIESHGYADEGFAPEENDYPGKLAAIKESIRKHNHGNELPIYITEAGIGGLLGTKMVYRPQAQFMTRLAIILKGEGVRVFLPFYGIDYDRDGWWGFCFNLEVDKNPWATGRISPKPSVNAIAVCAGLLEGATPVRRVRSLGEGIWAYLFERGGKSILAIWTPGGTKRVLVPSNGIGSVEITDIMGQLSQRIVHDGRLELNVDGSPQYVVGIPSGGLR